MGCHAAYPQQAGLASGGVLPRNKPELRGKDASLTEGCAVADGGNDGRGHNRPDPWNLPDAGTTRIGGGDPLQLKAEFFNLGFDCLPLVPKLVGQVIATNDIQSVSLFRLPFNERLCGRNLSTSHCDCSLVIGSAKRIRAGRSASGPLLQACCNALGRCAASRLSVPLEGAPSN